MFLQIFLSSFCTFAVSAIGEDLTPDPIVRYINTICGKDFKGGPCTEIVRLIAYFRPGEPTILLGSPQRLNPDGRMDWSVYYPVSGGYATGISGPVLGDDTRVVTGENGEGDIVYGFTKEKGGSIIVVVGSRFDDLGGEEMLSYRRCHVDDNLDDLGYYESLWKKPGRDIETIVIADYLKGKGRRELATAAPPEQVQAPPSSPDEKPQGEPESHPVAAPPSAPSQKNRDQSAQQSITLQPASPAPSPQGPKQDSAYYIPVAASAILITIGATVAFFIRRRRRWK